MMIFIVMTMAWQSDGTTALLMLMMPSTNFTLPFLHIPEHLRPCRRTGGKDVGANFKRFEQLITRTTDNAPAYVL